ncbi:hypothetical protein ABPG74_012238 [Tetrahymena malaccensis]
MASYDFTIHWFYQKSFQKVKAKLAMQIKKRPAQKQRDLLQDVFVYLQLDKQIANQLSMYLYLISKNLQLRLLLHRNKNEMLLEESIFLKFILDKLLMKSDQKHTLSFLKIQKSLQVLDIINQMIKIL